jgi:hypothetical protein
LRGQVAAEPGVLPSSPGPHTITRPAPRRLGRARRIGAHLLEQRHRPAGGLACPPPVPSSPRTTMPVPSVSTSHHTPCSALVKAVPPRVSDDPTIVPEMATPRVVPVCRPAEAREPARAAALRPELAATEPERRPHDLRHAALSVRLGRQLHTCRSRHPRGQLYPGPRRGLRPLRRRPRPGRQPAGRGRLASADPVTTGEASGSPNRLLCPDPFRHMSVISRLVERVTANRSDLRPWPERVVDVGPLSILAGQYQ